MVHSLKKEHKMIKQSRCWYLTLLFLTSAHINVNSTSYYYVRSQASNSALELAGWTHEVNLFNDGSCENYHTNAITFEYMQSFNTNGITRSLLGDDCLQNTSCPSFKVTGSRVANRGATDWLADYLGLPTDFESTITLKPKIQNYLVDFNGYYGLDAVHKGLYFRVHAPVVHTQWNLNYQETVDVVGTAPYIAGYFTDQSDPRNQLNDDFYSYMTNADTPNLGSTLLTPTNLVDTISIAPLAYSRWAGACQRKEKTALAEITMALGYNFWQCDNYHAGFNIRGALPTGNRPKGDYLFEPIVGNSHHWELGAGFTGHYTFWNGCTNDRSMGIYLDANLTHLFADRQVRVFDLKNGCNSRYMLASRLGEPVDPLFTAGSAGQNPSAEFQFAYSPVANLTRSFVDVSIGVQADITLLFNYTHCNWSLDCGYNLWARSKENIKFETCGPCKNPLINNQRWVLKGDAQMVGFLPGEAFPLSASQSKATIHQGTNHYAGPNTDPTSNAQAGINGVRPERNPGVDNAQLAFNNSTALSWSTTSFTLADQINTSLDPIFISPNDIDIAGAETKGVSNKLFIYLGYTGENYDACYIPYLGVGTSAEWGSNRNSCNSNSNNNCDDFSSNADTTATILCNDNRSTPKCAVSQWSVWFKAGISFN